LHHDLVLFGKEDRICVPNLHDSHSKTWNLLSLGTILFNFDEYGWPK